MGSAFLQLGTTMTCPHGGNVTAVATGPRITAGGAPVLTKTDVFTIVGCPFVVGTKPQPCVRVQWQTASLRSRTQGKEPLTRTSVGVCMSAEGAPQGNALILVSQMRAEGL